MQCGRICIGLLDSHSREQLGQPCTQGRVSPGANTEIIKELVCCDNETTLDRLIDNVWIMYC